MKFIETFYPESKFGGFTHYDGTVSFFIRVNALLKPSFTVLDVGCGRGEYRDDTSDFRKKLRILKGKVKKVIGIDLDPAGKENPYINKFLLLQDDRWPIKTGSVDLVLCDWVMEHLPDPNAFFREAHRVLKKGGFVCVRTPNSLGYASIAARLVPNRLHSRVTSVVQKNRKSQDVFPTKYRCNTRGKLSSALTRYGFENAVYSHEPEPAYLNFSKLAYGLGYFYQKIVPPFLKGTLLAFGQKK